MLIALFASIGVLYFVRDDTYSRVDNLLPKLPGYKKTIYTNIGFGFIYPEDWELEDYAFHFGGGALDLVRNRSTDGLIETQRVVITIENIAKHHWDNAQAEYTHFLGTQG